MSDDRHTVDPAAAIALAAAAGFDTAALEKQLPHSPEALQAQIGELEKRIEQLGAQTTEGQGAPAPAPHEQLAEALNAAQSRWLTLGEMGGQDGEAA